MEHIKHRCDDWLAAPLRLGRLEPRALVHGAACFAHAWAPHFGPMVAPATFDVLVPAEVDACALERELRQFDPGMRWRVEAVESPMAYLGRSPVVAGCAGLRMAGGAIEYVYAHPQARADIESGVLRPNRSAMEAQRYATSLLELYPGLRAPFLGYEPKQVHASFEVIEHEVIAGERGGRVPAIETRDEDAYSLGAIDDWHAGAVATPLSVPLPGPSCLPVGDPWTAPDDYFREWLMRQTFLRDGPPEEAFLREALAAQRGDQKPTHQGWETWLHAIVATLQLETDALACDRRALRVATLLHDVGKTHNVWTPGAHPLIGAKQWSKLRPDWLSDEESQLVTFLIRTHDLLGRMDRALTTPGFRGGAGPAAVRVELAKSGRGLDEALRLHSAVYTADIAAVSALRWLMPLTPLLEALVLTPVVSRRPAVLAGV